MKDREPARLMDEFRLEKERAPEPIEILPENFGDLKAQEAAPIFSRAAARIEITKPKNDFWQGVSENLRGAAIYFEAQKAKIASRTVSGIVGASLATNLLVACSPRTVEAFPPPEPTPTTAPQTQETQIAPAPTQEYQPRPISNVYVLEGEALFQANDDIEAEFEKFQESFLAAHEGSLPENVRLTATGMLTEYSDAGDLTLHPLFAVESDNPEVASSIFMLISIPGDGGNAEYKLIPLVRSELVDESGSAWVTLSVARDTRTDQPLSDPLEVFAIREQDIQNPNALVFWSPSGNALDQTSSFSVKVLAALANTSGEVESATTYQLEDGTQTERVTEGQLVELFPGSEVYMSDRGDVVIINEETGIRLAGQQMRTEYGTFTLLLGDSHYRLMAKNNYRTPNESMGGYPDIANHPNKEEIGRIISTLIELKEREVSLGGLNLVSHNPKDSNFIAIFMNPGTAIPLSETLPENFIDPNDARQVYSGVLGYPILTTNNGEYVLLRFSGTVEPYFPGPESGETRPLFEEASIYAAFSYYFRETFYVLLRVAAASQGTSDRNFLEGYKSVRVSPFYPLFSNSDIDFFMEPSFNHERGPFDAETMPLELERAKFGISKIIEVDFNQFE